MFDGRIFVCADSHGDPNRIRHFISQIDSPTESDTIIIAGDAGFEYQDRIMGAAKRATKKFPGYWIVMRGNHDSSYWAEHTITEEDGTIACRQGWRLQENGMDLYIYQKKYPNILYVMDTGGIYHIGKYNFLFLPGAYSVDKEYRLLRNYPYNPNEQLTLQEQEEFIDLIDQWNRAGGAIDFVIGHTFPHKLEPKLKYLFLDFIDQSTIDKRTEDWLNQMAEYYEVNPFFKQYFGGHYHDDKQLTNDYCIVYNSIAEVEDFLED